MGAWILLICFFLTLPAPLGTCLFWEFATEYYDLGFGVSFEWSQPQTKNITVAVNESDDDEFAEDDKAAENESSPPKPRIDEVLPVVRRPCNEEVIVGSHMYPGRGVYLLKFDNSYSLFRSKTLYYRVYYTRWWRINDRIRINVFIIPDDDDGGLVIDERKTIPVGLFMGRRF